MKATIITVALSMTSMLANAGELVIVEQNDSVSSVNLSAKSNYLSVNGYALPVPVIVGADPVDASQMIVVGPVGSVDDDDNEMRALFLYQGTYYNLRMNSSGVATQYQSTALLYSDVACENAVASVTADGYGGGITSDIAVFADHLDSYFTLSARNITEWDEVTEYFQWDNENMVCSAYNSEGFETRNLHSIEKIPSNIDPLNGAVPPFTVIYK